MDFKKTIPQLIAISFIFLNVFTSYGQIEDKLKINGYSSFEFEYDIDQSGNSDDNASFDADLFDIVFNFQVTDKLRVNADLTWEHGTATENDLGNAGVEYAFPEYTVRDWLKFRVGKMFTSFGIYNEIHTAKPAFLAVKEPLSTNKNHKLGSQHRFYPRWIAGIAVLGNGRVKYLRFDYIFQMSNGTQEETNEFEEDNNIEKAFTGRIRLKPKDGLMIGFSSYTNKETEFDSLLVDKGNRTADIAYGTFLQYNPNKLGIELEWVSGIHDPTDEVAQKAFGYTAMVSYLLKKRYTPFFRYEFLDPNISVDDDFAQIYSLGLNCEIDKGLFFKIQYNNYVSQVNNSKFGAQSFNEIQVAIVVGF